MRGSNGGSIFIGSDISKDSSDRNRGKGASEREPVALQENSNILIEGGSRITSSSIAGNSGSVELAAETINMERAVIQTNAGDRERNIGAGEAGEISLTSDTLTLRGGVYVTSNALSGAGGNINVDTEVTLAEGGVNLGGDSVSVPGLLDDDYLAGSVIQAVSETGITGTLNLTSPIFDVSAVVNDLDSPFVNSTALVRDPCAAFIDGAPSTLVTLGNGGLPLTGASTGSPDVTSELLSILDNLTMPGEMKEKNKEITDFLFVPTDGGKISVFDLLDSDAAGHDCEGEY